MEVQLEFEIFCRQQVQWVLVSEEQEEYPLPQPPSQPVL